MNRQEKDGKRVDGGKRIWLRLVLGFKLVVGAGIRGRVFFLFCRQNGGATQSGVKVTTDREGGLRGVGLCLP